MKIVRFDDGMYDFDKLNMKSLLTLAFACEVMLLNYLYLTYLNE